LPSTSALPYGINEPRLAGKGSDYPGVDRVAE
jgi:hypothetical protein